MDWSVLLKVLSTLVAILGAVFVVLGLPGTFLAWIGVVIYAVSVQFKNFSGWVLLGTFFGCALVEVADNLLSGLMVRKFGASKSSMIMTWVGGLGGAILGSLVGGFGSFIGSAILGLVGAFAGSYVAVYCWERYRLNRTQNEAKKAALGTVLGRLLGIAVKLVWIVWLLTLIW